MRPPPYGPRCAVRGVVPSVLTPSIVHSVHTSASERAVIALNAMKLTTGLGPPPHFREPVVCRSGEHTYYQRFAASPTVSRVLQAAFIHDQSLHHAKPWDTIPDGTPVLSAASAACGIEHVGGSARLVSVLSRAEAGEQLTLAVLGGSVSAGSNYKTKRGASGKDLYHQRAARVLSALLPGTPVAHHQGALAATGPSWFDHCAETMLPSEGARPLVVILEFALNTQREPASYERLLRRLLARRPVVAVVAVNIHRWVTCDAAGRPRDGCWRRPPSGLWNLSARSAELPELHSASNRAAQQWSGGRRGRNRTLPESADEDAIAHLCRVYDVAAPPPAPPSRFLAASLPPPHAATHLCPASYSAPHPTLPRILLCPPPQPGEEIVTG